MKLPLFSLLAAFALTLGTAAAQIQPAPASVQGREHRQTSPEERATRRSEQMTKELDLTADQGSRIKQVLLTRAQEMQAMRGQGKPAGAARAQKGAQMKANRAKYDAQFKEILTADQYTKFTALAKDKMQRGGHDKDGVKGEKVKARNGKVKVKTTES